VRQRKAPAISTDGISRPAATGSDASKGKAKQNGDERDKVVSTELRMLLNRKVIVLDKKDVKKHGGGVGN